MLKITPIQTKEEQETLCSVCSVSFDADCLAYRAYDDGRFLAISQFRPRDGYGLLKTLAPAPGVEDFEAMFILGRATMNFIDLLGLHTCVAERDAGELRLLKAIGFKEDESGRLVADMTDMFSGHCGGHCVTDAKE